MLSSHSLLALLLVATTSSPALAATAGTFADGGNTLISAMMVRDSHVLVHTQSRLTHPPQMFLGNDRKLREIPHKLMDTLHGDRSGASTYTVRYGAQADREISGISQRGLQRRWMSEQTHSVLLACIFRMAHSSHLEGMEPLAQGATLDRNQIQEDTLVHGILHTKTSMEHERYGF
jgi:hypothetical protein